MTELEKEVLNRLVDAWNAFCKLPIYHPAENHEFSHAIHAAQHIVMARAAVREEPCFFHPIVEKDS